MVPNEFLVSFPVNWCRRPLGAASFRQVAVEAIYSECLVQQGDWVKLGILFSSGSLSLMAGRCFQLLLLLENNMISNDQHRHEHCL